MAQPKTQTATASAKRETALDKRIENILHDKLAHFLTDIDFRISQANAIVDRGTTAGAREGKVYAEDLNLIGRHFLTGYTITANTPAAGSIAWANLHVVYNGVDTTLTDGNTALKYAWWSPTTTPTVVQVSNTKPVLAAGEVLLFVNTGGTPKVMLSDTNQSLPSVLGDASVDSGAIIANAVTTAAIATNAVTSNELAANAVTAGQLADGAVTRVAQLAANVVTSAAIADNAITSTEILANAVTSAKVADGAVNRAAMLSGAIIGSTNVIANAITSAALADGAVVRAGQLGTNVVTAGAILANSVTSAALADGSVVRAGQLAANVVTSTQIADGAVTSTEVAGGAISATKLSILRHIMY